MNLAASATAPAADPKDGTYWFDTDDSLYGIQQWNGEAITTTGGQQFTNKVPHCYYRFQHKLKAVH